MGYRSDVGICLTRTALETFKRKVEQIDEYDIAHELELLLKYRKHIYHDPKTGSEAWYWESEKWYSEYVDVGFIEKFLSELPAEEYRFMRVGDDYEDNEVNGRFYMNPFDMSLIRQITFENTGAMA